MSTLRRDPLTHGWVIFAEDRYSRPPVTPPKPPELKSGSCAFCPGNESMTPKEVLVLKAGEGQGWRVRAVPNQFAVLRIEGKIEKSGEGPYDRMNGIGA